MALPVIPANRAENTAHYTAVETAGGQISFDALIDLMPFTKKWAMSANLASIKEKVEPAKDATGVAALGSFKYALAWTVTSMTTNTVAENNVFSTWFAPKWTEAKEYANYVCQNTWTAADKVGATGPATMIQ